MTMNQIETALLAPAGLTEQDIADTLSSIATRQIDYADIYFQSSWHESLVLEDSIIKDGSFNIDCGVGVRAVSGEKPVCLFRPNSVRRFKAECHRGAWDCSTRPKPHRTSV